MYAVRGSGMRPKAYMCVQGGGGGGVLISAFVCYLTVGNSYKGGRKLGGLLGTYFMDIKPRKPLL